ncbi:MAG: hypothetical protein HY924_00525 [Elusimicrobia bacterium]|nr:hypothetical protein [Elusimicrobiota bacterium]
MMGLLLYCGLLISAVFLARNYLGRRTWEALLLGSILTCCEGVLMVLALGSMARLTPRAVTAAVLALTIVQGLVALFHQREELPVMGGGLRSTVVPPAFWLAAAVLAAALGVRLALAWLTPSDSWDGLSYHLPIVFRWLRQGNLSLAGWPTFHRYLAYNGELLCAWLALLDGGRLETAKLGQVAALPLMLSAGAVLGRRLAGAVWALPCGIGALAVPLVLVQAGIPYVDLVYGAAFAACAACAVVYDRTGRLEFLAAFAAAFGLALGAKSTAYLQAPLIVLPLWTLWARRDLRTQAFVAFLPLSLLVLAVGGATYLRNWLEHANPVFPFEFKAAGWTLFNGPLSPSELLVEVEQWFVSSPLEWLWYPFRERFRGAVCYGTEHGFGPLFAACWAVFPLAAWSAWKSRNRAAIFCAGLVPMTLAAFFLLQPTREPRYVLFLPVLVLAPACLALRRLRGPARSAACWSWSAGVVFSCLGGLGWLGGEKDYREAWAWARAEGEIAAPAFYKARFNSLGQAWAALNERLETGDVVAVNYSELLLPWAGMPPRAQVHVVGHQAGTLPDSLYGELPQEWMNLLDSLRVRYFGLWEPRWYPGQDAFEAGCIERFPARFKLLGRWEGGMGKTALYEIVPRP